MPDVLSTATVIDWDGLTQKAKTDFIDFLKLAREGWGYEVRMIDTLLPSQMLTTISGQRHLVERAAGRTARSLGLLPAWADPARFQAVQEMRLEKAAKEPPVAMLIRISQEYYVTGLVRECDGPFWNSSFQGIGRHIT